MLHRLLACLVLSFFILTSTTPHFFIAWGSRCWDCMFKNFANFFLYSFLLLARLAPLHSYPPRGSIHFAVRVVVIIITLFQKRRVADCTCQCSITGHREQSITFYIFHIYLPDIYHASANAIYCIYLEVRVML
jgi:hypothetical protein